MSEPSKRETGPENVFSSIDRGELHSALFVQLVMQQSNLAMMLMGKTPHPETGKSMRDLEAARIFIEQLEMLEGKTKGNLSKVEEGMIKQTLMALRMAFVEAVEEPAITEDEPEAGPENKNAPTA